MLHSAGSSVRTTQNLLVNDDAELQSRTRDWTALTSILGWRMVRGAASLLCYSTFKAGAWNYKRIISTLTTVTG